MRMQSKNLMPGLVIFFVANVIGLVCSAQILRIMVDLLSPRRVIFPGPMAGIYFGLYCGLGFGLLAGLPFILSRLLLTRERTLTSRPSFWLLIAAGCAGLTVIGYYFVLGGTPPDTTITATTLRRAFLVPTGLLLLLAAYTAVILRAGSERSTADADQADEGSVPTGVR